MRKVIAAINMTLDGFCDHTAIVPDEEIHHHYANLIRDAGALLYGSTTYDLMKFWQTLLAEPSGEPSMDDFATAIDKAPKIVFSHRLENTGWASAALSDLPLKEKVLALKQQPGNDVFACSRSIINQLMKMNLIDELQLCIHPVVAGGGLPLFDNPGDRAEFRLVKTKIFKGGAVILYYEPDASK